MLWKGQCHLSAWKLILTFTAVLPLTWGTTFPRCCISPGGNRFEEQENCFLVGGGTNLGSGLPTIYESGRIASKLICADY